MVDSPLSAAPADVTARCDAIVQHYARRDADSFLVRSVRDGDFEAVAPGAFTEDYPAPMIANRIDTMARDMAASLSMLPTFTCMPASNLKEKAKAFADKRTRIANYYIESSSVQAQMPDAVDSYNCYGMFVAEVRPDFKNKTPKIKLMDGALAYPLWDQDHRTKEILVISYMSELQLAAYYPSLHAYMKREYKNACREGQVKVYRHQDSNWTTAYLPEVGGIMVDRVPNPMGKCTFVAIPRPTGKDWFSVPRGAYADLVYPLIASNEFRQLALEATYKAVEAPIAVPPDVPDVPYGPDAVIHTSNPQGINRLQIAVPKEAFQASELIDRDLQVGGMSPGSRSGSVTASVITGRGVDALGEGYSQQILLAQLRLAVGLTFIIELCFEMDEKYWPNDRKEIRGQSLTNPGALTYTPAKDIAGDHTVSVDYGFLLGLDANRALVYILQAHGAGLISTDTAERMLPFKLNLSEEANRIQLEQLRASLLGAVAASTQIIPQMLAQGGTPGDLLTQFADVVSGVQSGKPIEEVVASVFAPPPPTPAPAEDPMAAAMAAAGGGGGPNPATGQEDPNARQPLSQFLAGLTGSGQPNLSASVSRQQPTASPF